MNLRIDLTNARDAGRASARNFEFEAGPVTIGRSATSKILIEGDMISRTHLILDLLHGTWHATHQGSMTPTLLNNAPIPLGQPRRVNDGDVLVIGDFSMRASYGRETILPDVQPLRDSVADMTMGQATQVAGAQRSSFAGPAPTVLPPPSPAPGPAGRVVPSLFVLGGDAGKLELREIERPYVIGRAAGCDLVLSNTAVSRRHAIVRFDGSRIYVREAGARNPLRINERSIFGESPLAHGDVLSVGPVELRVVTESDSAHRAPQAGRPDTFPPAANPSWAAAAAADPPPAPHAADPPSAPVEAPRWDQVAQRSAAPDWAAAPATAPRPAPPPAPPTTPAPASPPASPPADWSAMAAPAARAPAAAPAWNVPAAAAAPPPPPPPAWDIPPAAAAASPPAPAWSPPPPIGAPAPSPPAPPMPFAAAPPPAISQAPSPAAAGVASEGAGLGGAPKVVARRASTHTGWLVAGVVCMLVALGSGIVLLIAASATG